MPSLRIEQILKQNYNAIKLPKRSTTNQNIILFINKLKSINKSIDIKPKKAQNLASHGYVAQLVRARHS